MRENFQWENDAPATAHFRRWARFHMQLAAYLWGSSGSFDRDGLPLIRMIALEYPDEPWAWTTIDEYILGDRLLVAPIQQQGALSRPITLPAGRWYPLLGGPPAAGGDSIATATLTEIPVYVPEGSLLVLFPDGVDTPLPAPGMPSAVTVAEIGGDREVWLVPRTAVNPAHALWNDNDGPAGVAQWTWSARPASAALPTTATFKGVNTPVTVVNNQATAGNGRQRQATAGNGHRHRRRHADLRRRRLADDRARHRNGPGPRPPPELVPNARGTARDRSVQRARPR